MKAILRVFLLIAAATGTTLFLVSSLEGQGMVVNADIKVTPGVIEQDEFANIDLPNAQRKPHVSTPQQSRRVDVKFCTS